MMKIWSLTIALLAAVLGVGITATTTTAAYASVDPVLEKDPPSLNASETVQMTIRPSDVLPPNGTATMSMEGTNDIDFKGNPPAGVTVIVTNETAVVTNQPIEPPGATAPAPAAAPEPEPEPAAEESSEDEEE